MAFSPAFATLAGLSLFTLNLHGYHPMGEAPRFFQSQGKRPEAARSDLHFFTSEEYERGNSRWLARLSSDLHRLAPDLILLQEVGAGSPEGRKDCDVFRNDGSNTARRLLLALQGL